MLRGESGAGRALDRDAKMEVWLVGSPCPHTESLSPPPLKPHHTHPTPPPPFSNLALLGHVACWTLGSSHHSREQEWGAGMGGRECGLGR